MNLITQGYLPTPQKIISQGYTSADSYSHTRPVVVTLSGGLKEDVAPTGRIA